MNKENKSETVILIHETVFQCLCRDLIDLFTAIGLIGVGVFMHSVAMQWVGAIIFIIVIAAKSYSISNNSRMTREQAIDFLQKEINEQPKGEK